MIWIMTFWPTIHLSPEELALEQALEKQFEEQGAFTYPTADILERQKAELRGSKIIASAPIKKTPPRYALNMKVPTDVIIKLKAKAAKLGMPYQTYINSELYKLANQD